MKAYFSGALYQKDKQIGNFQKIVEILKKNGCAVFEDTLTTPLDKALEMNDEERVRNYRNIVNWIDKADFSVIEGSFPSTLHIGHEITLTLEKNKPVVVLYNLCMKRQSIEAQLASDQHAVRQLGKLLPGKVEIRFLGGQTASETEVQVRVTGPNNTTIDLPVTKAREVLEACTDC